MFKEKLGRVVRHVDGSLGCVLMGFDGIQIDSVYAGAEVPEMGAIAIEVSNLLDKFRKMRLRDGEEVAEVSITAGSVTTLARVVAEDYLLVLALNTSADIHRAQSMLRLIAPSVEDEI